MKKYQFKQVFIPNVKRRFDVSDAERFGKIVALTTDIVDISNLSILVENIVSKLKTAKEDDYLIIGGAPLVNAIAFSFIINTFGRVNMLLFDARTRRYSVKTLSEQEIMT